MIMVGWRPKCRWLGCRVCRRHYVSEGTQAQFADCTINNTTALIKKNRIDTHSETGFVTCPNELYTIVHRTM